MAARFFLGLVESIIGPVFVIVTGNWWTRREQAFRTAFWLSGTPVSSCFSVPAVIITDSAMIQAADTLQIDRQLYRRTSFICLGIE